MAAVERRLVALGDGRGRGEHDDGRGRAGRAPPPGRARGSGCPPPACRRRRAPRRRRRGRRRRERREDGRARADDHARLAAADAPPLGPALARAEPAVQHRNRVAEAAANAIDHLMRERDLGHEEEHVAARGERALGGGQEDLRLAAAGDAVQQERGVRAAAAMASVESRRPPRAAPR